LPISTRVEGGKPIASSRCENSTVPNEHQHQGAADDHGKNQEARRANPEQDQLVIAHFHSVPLLRSLAR